MSSGRLFLNGLLASIARLRFTGTLRIALSRSGPKGLSSDGKQCLNSVSHETGQPHLHFDYLCTGLSRNQYKHKLEERGLDYDKADEDIYDKLRDRQPTALKNAQRLESHWRKSGRGLPERENPSTSVHQLVDVLNDLAALPPAH
jgi:hypothetical protein